MKHSVKARSRRSSTAKRVGRRPAVRRTRNPSEDRGHAYFVDRGHGIGRHSFNDTRIDPNHRGFRTVRQIIVSDTRGKRTDVYDLDMHTIRDLSGSTARHRPMWTWAEVEEVVSRDLASMGRSFGDPYGSFYDSTTFGLYNGKRPSWYPEAEWAKALLAGDRSRRKSAPKKTKNPAKKAPKRKRAGRPLREGQRVYHCAKRCR